MFEAAKQVDQHCGSGGNPEGAGEPVPIGEWPVTGNAGAEEGIVGTLELIGTELDKDSDCELVDAE